MFRETIGISLPLAFQPGLPEIMEHPHKEEKKTQAKDRYHQLVDVVPQLMWTATPDGVVDFVNQALLNYTGLPAEQLLGRKWLALVHPDDLIGKGTRHALRGNRPYKFEFRARRGSDGAYRWHLATTQPIKDSAGRLIRWCGTAVDIHDAKLAKETAERLAQRLTDTLESTTDGFVMLDHQWRITFVNKKAEQLLRRRRDELLGKVIWEEYGKLKGTEFDRQYRRVRLANAPATFEGFCPAFEAWFNVRACPCIDGLAIYFSDITEQRRLELFRTEQSAILRGIAAGVPIADVFTAVIELIEKQNPLNLCSILVTGDDGKTLRIGAAPNFPAEYNRAIDGLEIGPSAGSCGTAGFRREPVIVSDIANDPLWATFRELPMSLGLRACWSVPIFSGSGETLFGTFAVYSLVPRTPKQEELEMLAWCAQTLGMAIDRQKTMQALVENEKRSREQASLIDKARDAIFVRGIDGRILFWNKGAERLFGWTSEEAVGHLNKELLYEDATRFEFVNRQVLQHEQWSGEVDVRCKDGSRRVLDTRLTLVKDDEGKPQSVLSINTDITQRKAAEREIHRLAFYDPLTRLPNRQLLADRVTHALGTHCRKKQTGAVMFLDLDNFKNLNDTLGHDKGDELLLQVAQRLGGCLRDQDTLARWGGDEFVIMLEELGGSFREAAPQAEIIAEKLLSVFAQPFDLQGLQHRTTSSIGVTLFNGAGNASIDDILKQADLAMYQAKSAGRNIIRFYDPAMQAIITKRMQLETEIRRGLQRDEFVLHYQPQVECDARITGVEALVRWQHPQRGFVSPAEFIPLAEETGLILELGFWVLKAACRQLVNWEEEPRTAAMSVSVNVSALQFQRPDFVAKTLDVISASGADPRKLKLELTESLLISDADEAITKIQSLKSAGLKISLDDFGTGYSSLAYLKRLPLDQLKIDQSFTRDILTNKDAAAIVATIIALGKSLGFNVLVEGVETEAHHQFLCSYGCDAFQGYLFSKPLSAEDVNLLLARAG